MRMQESSKVRGLVFFLSDVPHGLITVLTGSEEDQHVVGFLPQVVMYDPLSSVTVAVPPKHFRDLIENSVSVQYVDDNSHTVNTLQYVFVFVYATVSV